jgi:FtsP/CotA-like multicopper oxidase with cupredoxin domain
MRLHADGETPAAQAGTPPAGLPANPVAEPDLAGAERHEIVFEGGAMGGLRGAVLKGDFKDMRELAGLGKLWAINGMMTDDLYADPPLLTLTLGRTYVFALRNRTAFPHPIHLHGHSFRILSHNGEAVPGAPIRDTVLLHPDDFQEIAFVADNPGSWMFHCHILEHQETAMMAVITVA